MLPYWLLFGFFAGGALTTRLRQRGEAMTMFWVGWAIMTLMIGLRFHVGVDWANYQTIWRNAGNQTLGQLLVTYRNDPVFYSLAWGLKNGGLPFWSLMLVCATVFTFGLFRYSRLQPNPWLAVTVAVPYLVIVVAMSGVRQATALGFVFLALIAFSEERTKAFLWWMLCAVLFHASAIIIFCFAGLSFAKNRFQAGALIALSLVVAFFMLSSTFSKYSSDYVAQSISSAGTLYRIGMTLLAALLFFLLRNRLQITPREHSLWRNMSLFAVASIPAFLLFRSSTAIDRLLIFAYPLQIGVLAHTPFAATDKLRDRVLITAAFVLYLASILFVFLNYAVNRHPYLPYRSYLFLGS
jgi:hypothetical protein